MDDGKINDIGEGDLLYHHRNAAITWQRAYDKSYPFNEEWPEDSDSRAALMAAMARCTAIEGALRRRLCTSDDPNNHQGQTCPVHESKGVDNG